MTVPVITCLSRYNAELVRAMAGRDDIEVLQPDPDAGQAQVAALVADADIVISDAARRYVLDATVIAAMRRCRLIEQPSVGYNTVDVDAASRRGIPVANAPGYNAEAVADWVLMAVLVLLRDGLTADAVMRRGEWPPWPNGRELGSLTVGVVGMGNIGSAVARRVHGFGSPVLYTSRRDHQGDRAGDPQRVELPELLRRSDIVTLHVPQTGATTGLIGAAELAAMRERSILVNASRGSVVDEGALICALREGRPAQAALDVFHIEPLAADSELRSLPNVYLSPHIAANSEQARERVHAMVATNLQRVLGGGTPEHVVNPEVLAQH
ncbi:MAG: 2-hydroxyacid dehydrogenase [Nakamurella sp.]